MVMNRFGLAAAGLLAALELCGAESPLKVTCTRGSHRYETGETADRGTDDPAASGLPEGSPVTLQAGRTEVVIEADAPKAVRFAADEMTNVLSQVFGAAVPVVTRPTAGRSHVFLGMNEWAASAGISTNALARDAFVIQAGGADVHIVGRDSPTHDPAEILNRGGWGSVLFEHATNFGVYDFLERYAGVRFYFPGELGTIVPRRDALAVPAGRRTVEPDFTSRFMSAWSGVYFEPDPKNRKKTQNYFRLRFETTRIPACHGSNGFRYQRRFAKTHPEYFALLPSGKRDTSEVRGSAAVQPGQLCWSSGVVEEMYEDAKSYLRGEGPEVRGIPSRYRKGEFGWNGNVSRRKYVDLMPQDGMILCGCEKCQAAAARSRSKGLAEETDLVWGAVSNIATRLTADGLDGVISMMAYNGYGDVPDFALPPNVAVMVAARGPWSMNNPKRLAADDARVIAWAKKLGHKVWMWNYPGKHLGLEVTAKGIPQVCPRAWVKYYAHLAPYVSGAFAESESDRWFYNYINYYVYSRVAWDNKADVEAILAEHDRLMFGAGAAEMSALYRRLEDLWMNGMVGNVVETPMGPVVRRPSDRKLWEEIYSPAVLAELEGLVRAAAAKVAPGSLEARRIELVGREFLTDLRTAAKDYETKAAGIAALKFELGAGEEHALSLVPMAGRKASAKQVVRTDVKVRRTEDALVVTFDCEEPEMDRRAVRDHRPDDPKLWQDDVVEIVIGSADRTSYRQIFVNSEGAWADSENSRIGMPAEGLKWNSGLTAKVERRASSWTAEITLPLSAFPELRAGAEIPVEFARERNLTSATPIVHLYHWSPYALGFSALENLGRIILK